LYGNEECNDSNQVGERAKYKNVVSLNRYSCLESALNLSTSIDSFSLETITYRYPP